MKMKRTIVMVCLIIMNILIMFVPWFYNNNSQNFIYGTIMLQNPIALSCLMLMIIGMCIKTNYGYIMCTCGWLGFIAMQIYECLTWYVREFGGSIDLSLSLKLCCPEFFVAIVWMCISYFIYRFLIKENSVSFIL